MEFNVVKNSQSLSPQVAMAMSEGSKLTQRELARLAEDISARHIDQIAVTWLGFKMHEIQTIRKSHDTEEQWLVIFDILQTWQNKNDAEDERKVNTYFVLLKLFILSPLILISECAKKQLPALKLTESNPILPCAHTDT